MLNRWSVWIGGAVIAASCGSPPADGAGGPGGGRGGGPPCPWTWSRSRSSPSSATESSSARSSRAGSTTIQPQAEGFLTKILVKSGRSRVSRARRCSRSTRRRSRRRSASLESVRAAREADAAFARQQAERAKSAARRRRGEPAGVRPGDGAAEDGRGAAQGGRRADPAAARRAGVLPRRSRRPPASSATSRCAQGDRVTRATVLTTVDDNTGLEVYVQRAGAAGAAAQGRAAGPARQRRRRSRSRPSGSTFVSPSVDDATQTVLVKAPLDSRGGTFRTDQFVRAQIVFEHRAGPHGAGRRRARASTGSTSSFVAEPRRAAALVARQRAVTLGPVVGNDYVVAGGPEGRRAS